MAAWERGPPTSVTAAAAIASKGVQMGEVACATNTLPDWKC